MKRDTDPERVNANECVKRWLTVAHPTLRLHELQVIASEPTRLVLRVWYDREDVVEFPTPYLVVAVDPVSWSVCEISADDGPQYQLPDRK